jgi:uncharacterized protein YlaN (UPF0358 family)
MENKELFDKVFGSEITNIEFFGTKEGGFNCLIYSKEGKQFFSNSEHKFTNIHDAFAFAYKERYQKDFSLSDINI